VTLCVWLLFLGVGLSRFIHVVTAGQHPLDVHWGCFCLLAMEWSGDLPRARAWSWGPGWALSYPSPSSPASSWHWHSDLVASASPGQTTSLRVRLCWKVIDLLGEVAIVAWGDLGMDNKGGIAG
jgi:hypothetical protein